MLPTVYSLVEPDTYDRCAVVPAWRPAAVLSHRTAAWLYGWLPEPTVVEATIPRGLRVTPPGLAHPDAIADEIIAAVRRRRRSRRRK